MSGSPDTLRGPLSPESALDSDIPSTGPDWEDEDDDDMDYDETEDDVVEEYEGSDIELEFQGMHCAARSGHPRTTTNLPQMLQMASRVASLRERPVKSPMRLPKRELLRQEPLARQELGR